MKKTLFLFITLIVVLHAAAGSAEKEKKAQPSKTTAAVQIKPVEAQQSQVQPAPAAPTAGEEINWEVISQGGTDGGSASYQVGGTITQTAVGYGSSASYQLNQGFWQSFEECAGRGDANGDGIIDAADVVYLINFLFVEGSPPPDPLCVGDCNSDGIIDAADVVYLINFLFVPGSPPPG